MILGQNNPRQIKMLCSLLGYSRQAYYQYMRAEEKRSLQQELIIRQVVHIRKTQKKIGARKLLVMLEPFMLEHGISIGRDTLFTLLADRGLLVRKRRRKAPRTTNSNHWYEKYPDLAKFIMPAAPNEVWVSDITYITLESSFAYLSLITDAYSHMIIGYFLSEDLSACGCVKALMMALKTLPEEHYLVHHSDRGIQYCSTEYVQVLLNRKISISMTQTSDPRDNAIAERVNGIIKDELLEERFAGFHQARVGVAKAISIYNNQRPHSSIDMLVPSAAHTQSGTLKRRWKHYYKRAKPKEVTYVG